MPKYHLDERYEFQQDILNYLVDNNGFIKRKDENFDTRTAMDPDLLWQFLTTTQPKLIEKLTKSYGDKTRETIINQINIEINRSSLLEVLKNGVYLENGKLDLLYPKPATTFSNKANELYQANIFSVMEEVHYTDSKERLDLVLFVNGLAIFAAELKSNTTSTGWNVEYAIKQWKETRDYKTRLLKFKAGVLAAFAVDLHEVYVTTELKGNDTYFLPFNIGNGEGVDQGAGNPANPNGFETSYLWEQTWTKENIMRLIERFIFLEHKKTEDPKTGKKKESERLIFPRFQQIRAVTRVLDDMQINHTASNYLIQHSAGSGKTNTIAWLAHSLVSLHDADDKSVVDTVLIVTDRIVVDRQLQDAILGLDHQAGVVKVLKEGMHSSDLADALAGNTKIIATTIHKFNAIMKAGFGVGETAGKHFAVIIDEAHSSTTGSYMSAVSQVLTEEDEFGNPGEEQEISVGDAIEDELARTGKQDNISVIAFTATPKATTLQLFGTTQPDGSKQAFDLYSMKQAIEEGFIMDVLNNYVTYDTYYKLNKNVEDDPELKNSVAKRKIAKFVEHDDKNITSKVEIILDHFLTHVSNELGGQGKAMIVTSGRESAVKYKQAFDKYAQSHGITSVNALIAFSGVVALDGQEYTEPGINGISENNLKKTFDGDDYQVLIVANKYQTGFDQPKLVAMYVDKKLRDVAAVQTLSRLNRTVQGYNKRTFVLDFKNSYDDIQAAFKPYFTVTTLGEQISPSDVVELDRQISKYGFLDDEIIHQFNEFLYQDKRLAPQKAKMQSLLDSAYRIIKREDEEKQLEIKRAIRNFLRTYSFLIQATVFANERLHERYNYELALVKEIDVRLGGNDFTVADKIVVDYVNQSNKQEFSNPDLDGDTGVKLNKPGKIDITEDQERRLSEIIDEMNEQLNLSIDGDVGAHGAMAIRDLLKKNDKLKRSAKVNNQNDFKFSVENELDDALTQGYNNNQDFFGALLNNPQFKKRIADVFIGDVYASLQES
ncbi:MAG: DEAD/DEAH box helicase family protein [Lactobacillaceae bacterium]|jgi:type I restriction enzyme R subunit|nr:DEAD/DEAH box helicase family protein [Lactobacillaceae bacterium]